MEKKTEEKITLPKERDFIEIDFPEGKKNLEILFTYKSEEYKKNYAYLKDGETNDIMVFQIVDDQTLNIIDNDKELDYLDEILHDFLEGRGGCGDSCCCGDCGDHHHECNDGCCCGDHEHEHHDEGCCCGDHKHKNN